MQSRHLKFHALAIAAICLVIVVLYLLIGPKPQPPVTETIGHRFITIDNATWGRNCDPFVEQALQEWRIPAQGEASPRPRKAEHNNVRDVIAAACNGKLTCNLPATSETLKVDPLPTCFKRLTVGYRCYDFDRLWTAEVGQGDWLELNCREETAPTQMP